MHGGSLCERLRDSRVGIIVRGSNITEASYARLITRA
jgi:hypothetical protein